MLELRRALLGCVTKHLYISTTFRNAEKRRDAIFTHRDYALAAKHIGAGKEVADEAHVAILKPQKISRPRCAVVLAGDGAIYLFNIARYNNYLALQFIELVPDASRCRAAQRG